MRILVTGGAGFIGSHLCRELHSHNHEVISIDSFVSGSDTFEDVDITSIKHDVINPIPSDLGHVDVIFHLACPASPPRYQLNPLHTMRTCTVGTYNILEYAKYYGAKVLFTSTSEVYGDPLIHPQPEHYTGNVSTTTPRSCYDEGKRAAETLCHIYREAGLDVRIVRLFNTYGPGMDVDDGRVVSNFIIQCLRKQPITVYGTGTQTRSLCYIDDTVSAIIRVGMTGKEVPSILNVGTPNEITVEQLAVLVSDMCGVPLNVDRRELPQADPTRRRPDISLIREVLGWNPTTSLHEGLHHTIDYFRSQLQPYISGN